MKLSQWLKRMPLLVSLAVAPVLAAGAAHATELPGIPDSETADMRQRARAVTEFATEKLGLTPERAECFEATALFHVFKLEQALDAFRGGGVSRVTLNGGPTDRTQVDVDVKRSPGGSKWDGQKSEGVQAQLVKDRDDKCRNDGQGPGPTSKVVWERFKKENKGWETSREFGPLRPAKSEALQQLPKAVREASVRERAATTVPGFMEHLDAAAARIAAGKFTELDVFGVAAALGYYGAKLAPPVKAALQAPTLPFLVDPALLPNPLPQKSSPNTVY